MTGPCSLALVPEAPDVVDDRNQSEQHGFDASALPEWPLGWYVVARSKSLRRGRSLTVTLASQQCLLFRTESGALGALDAHCPHMGAHLGHGSVKGERIECALHRWQIGVDGSVAGQGSLCKSARAWQVSERFGLVFVHLGTKVRAPVPEPDDADYTWITGTPVTIETDWHSMVVNGFDMPHLHAVHHRQLVEPAQLVVHGRERMTLRYTSRVTGRSLSDLIMKWLARDRIRVRQHCHGPVVIVETDLGFTKTVAVLGLLPQAGSVRAFGAFGIRPGLLSAPRLMLTRFLFTAFLRRDFSVIAGMRLSTEVEDEGVRSLAGFLRSLPRHPS